MKIPVWLRDVFRCQNDGVLYFLAYLRTADEDQEVTLAELKQFFIANEYKEKWKKTRTDISSKQIDKQAIKNFCV